MHQKAKRFALVIGVIVALVAASVGFVSANVAGTAVNCDLTVRTLTCELPEQPPVTVTNTATVTVTATTTQTPVQTTPTTTQTQAPPTGSWWSGQSDKTTTKDGSFAAWRGRSLDIGGVWAATDSASNAINSPTWDIANPGCCPQHAYFKDMPRMDYAFGAFIDGAGNTWAQAAAGAYDSRWTQQWQTLKTSWGSRDPGGMFVRFAHEFNGNWYTWKVTPTDVTNFKAAWVRWANLGRQHFPGAKLVWSPNVGSSYAYDIRTLWPGDQYVDVVGPDIYNFWPWANTTAELDAAWNGTQNGGPRGYETFRLFALERGKPMALPEWGNDGEPAGDASGGGDSVSYIERMHAWLSQHGSTSGAPGTILYEVYFNVTGYTNSRFSLYPVNAEAGNTQAAAKYAELW